MDGSHKMLGIGSIHVLSNSLQTVPLPSCENDQSIPVHRFESGRPASENLLSPLDTRIGVRAWITRRSESNLASKVSQTFAF